MKTSALKLLKTAVCLFVIPQRCVIWTKNYIAGNFKGNDYVEIGKSLLDDDEDRSQAAVADGNFWTKGDSLKTYTFKMRDTFMSWR